MSDDVLWRYRGNDDDVAVHDADGNGNVLVTLGYCFRHLSPKKARRMARALRRAAKRGERIRAERAVEQAGLPSGPFSSTSSFGPVVLGSFGDFGGGS